MNVSENLFLNFHAHQYLPAKEEIVIQSKFLQENLIMQKNDRIFFTAGLHPWHAGILSEKQVKEKLRKLADSKLIIAIGETGVDKIKGPGVNTQLNVLKWHIQIAEEYHLPLIIHSVKAHNEILKLNIDLKPKAPWVIHHFNGSKEMAFDFIQHGFYLSVSHHINNSKSRLATYFNELPIEKLFLETDDFNIDIKDLYQTVSNKLSISMDLIKKQFIQNLKNLVNA